MVMGVDGLLNHTKSVTVGIVGATGAVGVEMLNVFADRTLSILKDAGVEVTLRAFASERSKGKVIKYGNTLSGKDLYLEKTSEQTSEITVDVFTVEEGAKCDVLLLASTSDFAKENCDKVFALNKNCIIIDNSSAFRYTDEIPLVIPEINPEKAFEHNLIANPNCTTAIMAMAVYPLHKKFGVKKAIVSTYQAASGAGKEGMEELKDQMTG